MPVPDDIIRSQYNPRYPEPDHAVRLLRVFDQWAMRRLHRRQFITSDDLAALLVSRAAKRLPRLTASNGQPALWVIELAQLAAECAFDDWGRDL